MACKDKNCACNKNKKNKSDILEKIKQDKIDRIEELKQTIADYNPEAMFADGFDHAIMGYSNDLKVIYSANMILETLVERDGMTPDEAIDYFNFNIEGAYVGEYTPIFMHED